MPVYMKSTAILSDMQQEEEAMNRLFEEIGSHFYTGERLYTGEWKNRGHTYRFIQKGDKYGVEYLDSNNSQRAVYEEILEP